MESIICKKIFVLGRRIKIGGGIIIHCSEKIFVLGRRIKIGGGVRIHHNRAPAKRICCKQRRCSLFIG